MSLRGKVPEKRVRLILRRTTRNKAYMLEFGDLYLRVYKAFWDRIYVTTLLLSIGK